MPNGRSGRALSLQHEGPPLLARGDRLHGDKNRLEPEEPHLHLDVLRLATPVQKEFLGAADPVPPGVANPVPHVVLEGPGRAAGCLMSYRRVWRAQGPAPFFDLIVTSCKMLA